MCVKCVGMRVCMCVGGEDEVCEGEGMCMCMFASVCVCVCVCV